jgi:hypothetical protein
MSKFYTAWEMANPNRNRLVVRLCASALSQNQRKLVLSVVERKLASSEAEGMGHPTPCFPRSRSAQFANRRDQMAIPAKGALMGVQVNYPIAPHGNDQSDFNMNSNNGATGTAWIDNNVLLFEIENLRADPDQCVVTVSDSSGNNLFAATGTLTWQSGDYSIQYVEFSDFPPLPDGDNTPPDQCNYQMSVVNTVDGSSGTEVRVRIYRG